MSMEVIFRVHCLANLKDTISYENRICRNDGGS